MSNVKLVWITPNADDLVTRIARVSNPAGQEANVAPEKLISHFLTSDPPHWSPFDMVCACLEVTTTRDIAHQAIRHWSFRFQEFSQRYATVDRLPESPSREARKQDKTNRQHSLELPAHEHWLQEEWDIRQQEVRAVSAKAYDWAIDMGLAKECARVVLPEGLTPTRYYMQGTLRSWLTYCQVRTHMSTQKEHRLIAEEASIVLRLAVPIIWEAAALAGMSI